MSSLYNRYEPKNIDEVLGQDLVVNILKKISVTENIPNNFIFCGMGGTGKTLLAKLFSKMINCLEKIKPCNKCKNCICINNNTTDIIETDGSTNTGVDYIRTLQEMMIYGPMDLKYKIFIIDEVHMLSRNSFDSLLMTLQNPPSYIKFMFATTNINKIPQTIISRCVVLPLKKIDEDLILKRLNEICFLENKKVPIDILTNIVRNCDGSLRESLSLLEPLLFLDSWENVDLQMGFLSSHMVNNIWHFILEGNPSTAIELWNTISKNGCSEKVFLKEMSRWLKNQFLIFTSGENMNWKCTFSLLANFWEIITSQMEALYMDCSFIIETTIVMLCFVQDTMEKDF